MTWAAATYAIFVWWFSTGAILYVVSRADDRGPDGYLMSVIMAIPVLFLGSAGVVTSLDDASVKGAFVAFTASLLVWGWFEMAFLAGVITGPNLHPTPLGAQGMERFVRAWGAIAYSEMALIFTAILIVLLSLGEANQVAMWTYLVLFFARIFAKLNVYLGVPNINDEFLPRPVRHLTSHFRKAPMNPFFPVSVTLLTAATFCWADRAVAAAPGSGAETGFVLLAAITALALLEHWMMVLPLQDAALWRWLLPSPNPKPDAIKTATSAQERGHENGL